MDILRWLPLGTYVIVNAALFLHLSSPLELLRTTGYDWDVMVRGAELAGQPELYADRYTSTFIWSPLAAYVLQLIAPLGLWGWRAILFVSALAMPTWTLRLLVLGSWPFWFDVGTGNIVTIILLAAAWAVRGSQVGTFAFLNLALLRPMPLLLPLVLWILWKRPEWRLPAVGLVAVHAVLILASGLAVEWVTALVSLPGFQDSPWNWGPTQIFGWWWMLAGIPLGAWLFLKGRPGWAGLAISPYIWGYYGLFALLPTPRPEAVRPVPESRQSARRRSVGPALRRSAP